MCTESNQFLFSLYLRRTIFSNLKHSDNIKNIEYNTNSPVKNKLFIASRRTVFCFFVWEKNG